MAVISSVSFDTQFKLNASPAPTNRFILEDTTDYAGAGIPLTGVKGVFEITSPSSVVVYNNTTFGAGSDIVRNISAFNAITIPLPNLSNQAPENGVYTIVYTVQITDGVNPTYTLTQTNSYNFTYTAPTVAIVAQADCISPLITGQDDTEYIVDGVQPSVTRTFTLDYPSGSGESPISTSSATITTGRVFTGTQTFTVSSVLLYTFSDGHTVADTVTGAKGILVDCQLVCKLYCCLKTLYNRKENARASNQTLFQSLERQFEEVMSIMQLLFVAIDCGKQNDANTYLNKIEQIAECSDDCGCNDGTPQLVNGLGPQNVNVVVDSCGTPITVTPVTAGGITTYTVCFDANLVTKINNSYNTVVVAGTGMSVVDSGVVNGVRTFTVNSTAAAAQNRCEFRCRLEFSNFAVPQVTITEANFLTSGANMTGTATVAATEIADPNWDILNNLFTVSAFQTASNANYKVTVEPSVQAVDYTAIGGFGVYTASQVKNLASQLRAEIMDVASGAFKFRLVVGGGPGNGIAPTNKIMVAIPDIYVFIKISE
jgi:hypothetical protein